MYCEFLVYLTLSVFESSLVYEEDFGSRVDAPMRTCGRDGKATAGRSNGTISPFDRLRMNARFFPL
jgi:hypothetical protein